MRFLRLLISLGATYAKTTASNGYATACYLDATTTSHCYPEAQANCSSHRRDRSTGLDSSDRWGRRRGSDSGLDVDCGGRGAADLGRDVLALARAGNAKEIIVSRQLQKPSSD